MLQKVLNEHRVRVDGLRRAVHLRWRSAGHALNLANLTRRVIVPACTEYSAEIRRPVVFKGWKAFRTSLATNLLSCGVDAKVIQAILRHSDIATTLSFYTQVPDADSRRALQKIEDLLVGTGRRIN